MKYCLAPLLLTLLLACASPQSTSDNSMDEEMQSQVVRYWVNSSKVDCQGVGLQQCLQIQRGDTLVGGGWKLFYDRIDGFDYEEGFLYHLRVRETQLDPATVPADASSMTYQLVELINRTPDTRAQLGQGYELEAVGDTVVEIPPDLERPTLLIDVEQGRMSGTDGCNRLSGEANVALGGSLSFGQLVSTRKACRSSQLPRQYQAALSEVRSYVIRGGKLYLQNAGGEVVLRMREE